MRRPLLLALAVLAAGAAAWPASARHARPALTLSAPGATTFGHTIDFRGRLRPAEPGRRVSLYRGDAFVAASATRADGSFRIAAAVGRPGPFHVAVGRLSSRPVTVRIVPFLDTKLVGPRVAGSPLRLEAALRPTYAGRLRVRIVREGTSTFSGLFGPVARVKLGTGTTSAFRIEVEGVPRPGFDDVARTVPVALRPPSLSYGAQGPIVEQLTRQLHDLGYAVPSITSTFDGNVVESVYAFEKAQGLDRTGVVDAAFWERLASPLVPRARYAEPAAHIEIDKAKQVLYLVRNGEVKLVVPVSTAGIAGYYTPEGRFAIYRKVPGYDPSPLGILYKPMYFVAGYAIHGSPSVPPYPASHGCVRVPNFVIERLYESEPYGEAVFVY